MNKAKANALDALRALIAERQQYEQWISVLESKRDGTPAHVFEKVNADYEGRLDRVVGEIAGHAEELQLSITTLSSRLIEVARDEDTRRDTLQEAELRAAVGEYEPARWEEIRVESQRDLDRIAGDRERLDGELAELRSIQTLSVVGSRQPSRDGEVAPASGDGEASTATETERTRAPEAEEASAGAMDRKAPAPAAGNGALADGGRPELQTTNAQPSDFASASARVDARSMDDTPAAVAAPSPVTAGSGNSGGSSGGSSGASVEASARPRPMRTPLGGTALGKSPRPADSRVEQSKTLKCPECGTPNHPTEWYCERCGGELATM